jgi:lipopolysaccharide biosynthesis glycosyltransferase
VSDRLEIACAVEGDYVFHCAAMLHSVIANRGEMPVRIHYLHGPELDRAIGDRLGEMVEREPGCSVSFVEVDDARCEGLPTEGFTKKATWYRIFLPELLGDIGRVLSLDVDLIVVDALEPLWATDLGGAHLGAVTNVLAPMYMSRPAELGLQPTDYFNAGVMLLDLDRMRADDCAESIRRYAVENADDLVLRDQDALNFVLADRRRALHPRWNSMNALLHYPWAHYVFTPSEIEEALRAPAIRHFEGPDSNKPWHYLGAPDAQALYRAHRLRTPWPDYQEAGRTPGNIARRLRRRLRDRRRESGASTSKV